jgi:adenylate cyclase
MTEGKEKRQVAQAFSQYLSPLVIHDLLNDPRGLRLGGQSRDITVFFSDIEKFSTFSEKMTDPELVDYLNVYLTAMTDLILEHRGLVDKYVGDAIMAFWGAPELLPIDATQACLAALDQLEALPALNEKFRSQGKPVLRFRAGLNRGPATVGNMGSTTRFSYTAMGDTVNTASRLEGANKFFGTSVMVSESVRAAAGSGFVTRRLGSVLLVGKGVPIEVHELVGRRGKVPEERLRRIALHEEGLRLLEQGKDREAAARFDEELKGGKDLAAESALAFAREREAAGGTPWNGVWELTSKG